VATGAAQVVDFVNETKFAAGWTLGFERDGRELVIVAIKATFLFPEHEGAEAVLAEQQVPLVEADRFTGKPGFSAPLYETDYAHRKPYCDVLLNGSAYAPRGRPTQRVTVGLSFNGMSKSFDVVGNRVWRDGVLAPYPTQPEPFTVKPISYDVAFGGFDDSHPDPNKLKAFLANPVGRGYRPYLREIDGLPLPNTEETGKPIKDPGGNYKPMSFGPIGRNWQWRAQYAGTYDQPWLDHRAPFWPDDFDYKYFQAAPSDQQFTFPKGGDEVALMNLTPRGLARFRLPKLEIPVVFIPYQGREYEIDPVLDTLLVEPDLQRISLTWRMNQAMKRDFFELRRIVVGKTVREIRRAGGTDGKTRYANLDELIRAQRSQSAR
jgi:hypothetical protein